MASVADTIKTKGQGSIFSASATASLRLSATFFEDRRQVGQIAKEEAHLLSHPNDFLNYQQSSSDRTVMLNTFAALGISAAPPSFEEFSAANRHDALQRIQLVGLAAFYKEELRNIAGSIPGNVGAGMVIDWNSSTHYPRFLRVLDHLSCQIIGGGAVIAAYTGNAPGALILGLWYIVEC